jgi:hypothetical protein
MLRLGQVVACAGVNALCVGGCGGALFPTGDALQSAAEAITLVSLSGNDLRLAKANVPEGYFDNVSLLNPPDEGTIRPFPFYVVSVDLETLEVTVVDEAADPNEVYAVAPPGGYGASNLALTLSDGTWTAMVDGQREFIRVINESTSEHDAYLNGAIDPNFVSLAGLENDRLVVVFARRFPADRLIIVIDLLTGRQQTVDRVAPQVFGRDIALEGDTLAFFALPGFDPETQSVDEFLTGPSIDVVDLSTGERRTLAEDVSPSYGFDLSLADGRITYVELRDDRLIVRAIDVATGERSTLATLSTNYPGETPTYVVAVSGTAALLREDHFSNLPMSVFDIADYEQSVSYVLKPFDGTARTIVHYTLTSVFNFDPSIAVLTNDAVVVYDPVAGELVVHEIATDETRRVSPFP